METVYHYEAGLIANLLVGRSITDVRGDAFILDNGTELRVVANEGCGGCTNGHYSIDFLKKVNNVITNVTLNEEEYGHDGTTYTINVYTEGILSEDVDTLVSVSGHDGNGYYGTGYRIDVTVAQTND